MVDDAPIEFSTLRADHLPQVHELLSRAFWSGIDGRCADICSKVDYSSISLVTESVRYYPEQCTIVATYKKLVVGAAFISSPQETYITYLAVKPGFENCHIATWVSSLCHPVEQGLTSISQVHVVSPDIFEPTQRHNSTCIHYQPSDGE